MAEREVTAGEIEREHLAEVHRPLQWAYMLGVIGGGTLLMLGFIAWLGG
jgi:hypothetical protein